MGKQEQLKTGFTTGTCAAAAAKAAAMVLAGTEQVTEVAVVLPSGEQVVLPVEHCSLTGQAAEAVVRKNAGDDPDVTHGSVVRVTVTPKDGNTIVFEAGEGVGTVTKPGLQIPQGEPAINPMPRQMIRENIRSIRSQGTRVTVAIPGGAELAQKTFNPRLGIQGGLSILGTTGIVRPYSSEALLASLFCQMDVALAEGCTHLVLVPGNIGHKAVLHTLPGVRDNQIVEVSNEWGEMLMRCANTAAISCVTMGGHPGKLAKLIAGDWNTHSRYSESAVPVLQATAYELGIELIEVPQTCQHVFDQLADTDAERLAGRLSVQITEAVLKYTGNSFDVRVFLFNMQGRLLGCNDQEVFDAE